MLEKSIERGNRNSVLNDEQHPHVTKLMTQDVELGYGIPLTVKSLRNIPGAEVYPIGCRDRKTIMRREK
ncbi:hypothetical protein ACHAXR_003160 [Thalassiosira sp. AJA248-18]